jgi:hypothetical protein
MYIYTLAPIDNWEGGWFRIDQFVKQNPELGIDVIKFAMEASNVAGSHGWEGDIRSDDLYAAHYSRLTLSSCQELDFKPTIIVAWKQDNNGICFVASRHPINDLERLEDLEGRIYPPPLP